MAKRTVKKRSKAQQKKAEEAKGIMERLTGKCELLKKHKLAAVEYEKKRKEENNKVAALSKEICELVEIADLQPPFNLRSGGKITIREDLSVKKEDEDALMHWLEANDEGDIIKQTVNAQTLKSLCKKREKENKPHPDGVTVTSYFVAQYKKK